MVGWHTATAVATLIWGLLAMPAMAQAATLRIVSRADLQILAPVRTIVYAAALRDRLERSDGTPIASEDCIASISRRIARDAFGQLTTKATGEQ